MIFAGQWSPHRFYPAHTIGTEGIEAHAILSRNQVFRELCLEQDEFFPTQETFKERVLCPLAKSQQDFVDFRAPFVIRNVVSNHITGG